MDNVYPKFVLTYTLPSQQITAIGGDVMPSDRKVVYFNLETELAEYEEANQMTFSAEVKKWLRERVASNKSSSHMSETIDTSKLGGNK